MLSNQIDAKWEYISTDTVHNKNMLWPAGQSFYQHIHIPMEVLKTVYSHHIADERGCGISDPVFLIQHFVFTYFVNSVPKAGFSGIGEQGKLTATEVMAPTPSFLNPFPTSTFDRETPNLISSESIQVTDQR